MQQQKQTHIIANFAICPLRVGAQLKIGQVDDEHHASLLISELDCVSPVTHWLRLQFACFPLFIRGQLHSSHFLLPNIENWPA